MNIRESILEKDPTSVKNVGKLSMGTLVSFRIREYTQGRSPINAVSVGKPLFRDRASFDIRESILEKSLKPQEFRKSFGCCLSIIQY